MISTQYQRTRAVTGALMTCSECFNHSFIDFSLLFIDFSISSVDFCIFLLIFMKINETDQKSMKSNEKSMKERLKHPLQVFRGRRSPPVSSDIVC